MEEREHFKVYGQLNDQLLGFILSGRSDTKEADDIRDQMDSHWAKMSKHEQDMMRRRNETALSERD